MPVIADAPIAAVWSSDATGDRIVLSGSQIPHQGAGFPDNIEGIAFGGDPVMSDNYTVVDETSWKGVGSWNRVATQHDDFHYRFWVIPEELRLQNPLVDTDIPFVIWNTYPKIDTLQDILVAGSSVLTFNKTPLISTIRDFEYQTILMRIGPGEPNVDALVDFVYQNGDAIFPVIAIVSETFNLIPDVPVDETWEYLTDIMTSYNGSEQRISLRDDPRRTLNFTVDIIDMQDRREQYELLFKNMALQAIVPNYHHAAKLTAPSPIASNRLYFDTSQTQMRLGEGIAIINVQTKKAFIFNVTTIYSDGVDIGSSLGEALTTGNYVYPAHAMILKANSGMTMQTVTGKLEIQAESFGAYTLPRPNATPTIETLDGYNIMTIRPLAGAEELFTRDAEVMDFETGVKTILRTANPHVIISGQRQWLINRYGPSAKEDYMREFINQVKGAQKAWLIPTWFPDLTLAPIATPTALNGVIQINEINYGTLLFPYDTWKRIMIQYDNLPATYHTVTSATTRDDGYVDLAFSPPLPDDPEVANIKMISFLLKVRGDDTIRRRHDHRDTTYSWAVTTTDAG
jgi:hypothetical protein